MGNDADSFYKKIGTFEKTYRSFKTADIVEAKSVGQATSKSLEASEVDVEFYTKVINLLFPAAVGSCLPIEDLWKNLSQLAELPNGATDDAKKKARQKLAKTVRVYHYSGNPDGTPIQLENEIQNFYATASRGGARPSAYRAPSSIDKTTRNPKLLRDMLGTYNGIPAAPSAKLSMILIDTPIVDVKLRSTEKVEAFINYSPNIFISQCVPYVDVRFILRRIGENPEGTPQDNAAPRSLNFMGQLKFLMGDASGQSTITDNTANALIYDSSILTQAAIAPNANKQKENVERTNRQRAAAVVTAREIATQKKVDKDVVEQNLPIPPTTTGASETSVAKRPYTDFIAGMETFTMPQTLINMDYDESIVRFNPIRNPTLPFGAIVSFTIEVRPSVGIMSFKTATLTLKIFDKSRLTEIADFINPRLYSAATLWVTYGWRAPRQDPGVADNEYFKFINENMMIREAFGIRNTSIQIDDAGVATVQLSLFTKGAAEIREVMTDALGASFDNMQAKVQEDMKKLSDVLKKLGVNSFQVGGSDIRGSVIVNSANGGTFPEVDAATYTKEIDALINALSNKKSAEAKDAVKLITELFKVEKGSNKPAAAKNLETLAKTIAATRFSLLKGKVAAANDLFAIYYDEKFQDDEPEMPGAAAAKYKLKEVFSQQTKLADPTEVEINKAYEGFGKVSFGRLFFNYFQQLSTAVEGVIDEFQVLFYQLNDRAGYAASLNIAEFPIDMGSLEKAYASRTNDQKGEKMSILNFLEIVRDSQFNDIRHRAFGFANFFVYKDGKYVRNESEKTAKDFQKSLLSNAGNLGSFVQPVVDFYVETCYVKKDSSGNFVASSGTDLLKKFEEASTYASLGTRQDEVKKIMRIHIYDKASTPHKVAATILKQNDGKFRAVDLGGYRRALAAQDDALRTLLKRRKALSAQLKIAQQRLKNTSQKNKKYPERQTEVDNTKTANEVNEANIAALQEKRRNARGKAPGDASDKETAAVQTVGNVVQSEAFDFGNPPSFQKVKEKIAEFVPTILIGSNGTAVQNVSYSSNQDALLSTIMMLRNNSKAVDPATPSGAAPGGLPLRVIPGQLSLTTMGCPIIDYMQQYFVDLGTGTTVDNLYNITGLTHNFSQGSFKTEIKFTFHDAYGQYESPQDFLSGIEALTSELDKIPDEAILPDSALAARALPPGKPAKPRQSRGPKKQPKKK